MRTRSILLAASLAAGLATPAAAEIKIGVVLSATGPASSLGIPERNALSLAPKEIGGQKVTYIVLDDATDPTAARRNIERLTTGEAGPYFVPVLDLVLAKLPAELDLSTVPGGEEVDEAAPPVFQLATDCGEFLAKIAEIVKFHFVALADRLMLFLSDARAAHVAAIFQ